MWSTIVKIAVKLALLAAEHPDEVKAVVDAVHAAKQK